MENANIVWGGINDCDVQKLEKIHIRNHKTTKPNGIQIKALLISIASRLNRSPASGWMAVVGYTGKWMPMCRADSMMLLCHILNHYFSHQHIIASIEQ